MESLKFVWEKLKGARIRFVTGLLLSVLISALIIVNPYLSKILIDDCIKGGKRDLLIPLILIMCGVVFVQGILRLIRMVCLEQSSQHMLMNIRKTIFNHIQFQDLDFFNEMTPGDIITRTTGDLEYMRHFCAMCDYLLVETIFMFISSIAMLLFVSVKLTLCLLCVMPLLFVTSVIYSKKVRPNFFAIRKQLSKLNTAAQENIDGNRVVKAFVREDYEIEKFSEKSLDFKNFNLKAVYMWQKIVPLMNFFAESLSIITLIVGGLLAINGNITLGDLTLFTSLTWALSMPMKNISGLLNDLQRFSTSAEKVMELCNAHGNIKDSENAIDDADIKGKIEFKNVSFDFEGNEILKDASFEINPGETIVVMGPTGCGKSTLINLLLRFYDPKSGEILLDGVNIKDRTIKSVRNIMGVATQDVFLFSDTIDGNIAFSDITMSEENVLEASNLACAHRFIKRMPEKYNTIIGERGVGLSGGQRQRIALARAFAKKPRILILDDTTSAVDMDTETKIKASLDSLPKETTKIIIAQRVSMAKNADKIFIMENKGFVCKTHNELIKTNDYYKSICEIQGVKEATL